MQSAKFLTLARAGENIFLDIPFYFGVPDAADSSWSAMRCESTPRFRRPEVGTWVRKQTAGRTLAFENCSLNMHIGDSQITGGMKRSGNF